MTKLIWGSTPQTIDPLRGGIVKIAGALLQWQYVIIIVFAALLMVWFILLEKTLWEILCRLQHRINMRHLLYSYYSGNRTDIFISMLITGAGGVMLARFSL